MADVARHPLHRRRSAARTPEERAARRAADIRRSPTDEGELARDVLIGAVIGVVVTFAFVGGLIWMIDRTASTALGVALMCAAFVGIGVGGMSGGIVALNREDARDRAQRRQEAHRRGSEGTVP